MKKSCDSPVSSQEVPCLGETIRFQILRSIRGFGEIRAYHFRLPAAAFTLLEVLMALALFAIIAAAAAPLLTSAFASSEADTATAAIEEAALTIRGEAVLSGQPKVAELSRRGITPGAPLPPNWTLEVRRLTDSRFRKPRNGEVWEFNSAGICEPITIRLSDGSQTVELRFDPLTAQTFDE